MGPLAIPSRFLVVSAVIVSDQRWVSCAFQQTPSLDVSKALSGRILPPLTSELRVASSESDKDAAIVNSKNHFQERYSSKHSMELLQDALYLNSTSAASALLSTVTEMRKNGEPTEAQDSFLNNLLACGPDAPLPFWARPRTLAKFSRRSRMASLRRTLDRATPPAASSDDTKETADSVLQRRRRALLSLLRSLAAQEDQVDASSSSSSRKRTPAIVILEKKSLSATSDAVTDMKRRLPEGLETPDYEIIASGAKNIEFRRYKPYSVCVVSMKEPRPDDSARTDAKLTVPELGGASAFGALAGYLFGKNDKAAAMKMTTPVFSTPSRVGINSEQEERMMEFVLPSEYWGEEYLTQAPMPLEGSGVSLQRKESEDRAVLMFGGFASKKEVQKRKEELLSSVFFSSQDPRWKPIAGTESLAQYNDPFTLPWRRLNEVSVKVEQC